MRADVRYESGLPVGPRSTMTGGKAAAACLEEAASLIAASDAEELVGILGGARSSRAHLVVRPLAAYLSAASSS